MKVGDGVEVEGILQTDGSILARKVEFEEPEKEEAEVKGTIKSIDAGAHSFIVTTASGPVTVKTDASTVFRGDDDRAGSFADLKVGDRVEVEGILQTDGSILARKVKIED